RRREFRHAVRDLRRARLFSKGQSPGCQRLAIPLQTAPAAAVALVLPTPQKDGQPLEFRLQAARRLRAPSKPRDARPPKAPTPTLRQFLNPSRQRADKLQAARVPTRFKRPGRWIGLRRSIVDGCRSAPAL